MNKNGMEFENVQDLEDKMIKAGIDPTRFIDTGVKTYFNSVEYLIDFYKYDEAEDELPAQATKVYMLDRLHQLRNHYNSLPQERLEEINKKTLDMMLKASIPFDDAASLVFVVTNQRFEEE